MLKKRDVKNKRKRKMGKLTERSQEKALQNSQRGEGRRDLTHTNPLEVM